MTCSCHSSFETNDPNKVVDIIGRWVADLYGEANDNDLPMFRSARAWIEKQLPEKFDAEAARLFQGALFARARELATQSNLTISLDGRERGSVSPADVFRRLHDKFPEEQFSGDFLSAELRKVREIAAADGFLWHHWQSQSQQPPNDPEDPGESCVKWWCWLILVVVIVIIIVVV